MLDDPSMICGTVAPSSAARPSLVVPPSQAALPSGVCWSGRPQQAEEISRSRRPAIGNRVHRRREWGQRLSFGCNRAVRRRKVGSSEDREGQPGRAPMQFRLGRCHSGRLAPDLAVQPGGAYCQMLARRLQQAESGGRLLATVPSVAPPAVIWYPAGCCKGWS